MPSTASRVVVLGTGGTIAGTSADAADSVGYTAAQLGIAQLLATVPGGSALPWEAEQVAQLDSKDMDFATWQRLAARCAHHLARDEVAGVVVTHGTDTLDETAYFLHRVLAPAKPLVLTAAIDGRGCRWAAQPARCRAPGARARRTRRLRGDGRLGVPSGRPAQAAHLPAGCVRGG
jgi:L-asparaginase/Glu-tRNA(Gln) amidotransferase subunit D